MGADTSSLTGIFKRDYDEGSDVLRAQQNLKAASFKKIGISPNKLTPQGTYLCVAMSGNEAGGAIYETGALQTPGSLNPQNPVVLPKTIAWPGEITVRAIELSESNKQAFMQTLDATMKDITGRIASAENRMFLGKGNGQITLANGSGSGATSLIVDNALYFRRGMQIDSYVSVGGAKEIDGATISAVNYFTNTLTITASTWSDNSIICMKGIVLGSNTQEFMGVQGICDTTSYSSSFEGLTVSANPEWQGNVLTPVGTPPISQDLLQQGLNRAMAVGNAEPNLLISNYTQLRVFLNTELQKTRYDSTEIKSGHTVLKWNNLEWMVDKDYDTGEVGMFTTDDIKRYQGRDVHLANADGNNMFKVVGYDKVGFYYRHDVNVGAIARNSHVRITGLQDNGL